MYVISHEPCKIESCGRCELWKFAGMTKLRLKFDGFWLWIEGEKPNYSINGKYLFFDEDKGKLIRIAVNEIENHGFHMAKVNMKLLGSLTEHVLCLYFKDDSRKYELAQRNKMTYGVKYRFWKSDEATSQGQYSKEFLNKLPEPLKRYFQTPRAKIFNAKNKETISKS